MPSGGVHITRVKWLIGAAAIALVASSCLVFTPTLGSTSNRLGRDPSKNGHRFWLNISGPAASKAIGDRFAADRCEIGEYNCSAVGTNDDYRRDGYFTEVAVSTAMARKSLVIQAYDPAFVATNDLCDANLPSATTIPSLTQVAAAYSTDHDALARYSGGATSYCSGDMDIEGPPPTTTFIVRTPDTTPLDDTDNPIVCAISFSPRDGPIGPMLVNPDGTPNTTTVGALDGLPLSAVFHRDTPICRIPAKLVTEGTYLVQVRTNAANPGLLPPTTVADPSINAAAQTTVGSADPAIVTGGNNRFALVAAWGVGPRASAVGVHAFAEGSGASMFLNAPDLGTANLVPLLTVPTGDAGHVLRIDFWDLGDWGDANLTIDAPVGTSAPSCTWARDGTPLAQAGTTATAIGCTVAGLTRGTGFPSVDGFNARLLEADVTLPADYQCDVTTPDSCLFSAAITYTSGVPGDPTQTPADTTTISVGIS